MSAAAPLQLDYNGVLSALHEMLGQRVTVMLAPVGELLVASFTGELHRGHIEDDMTIFVVGDNRDRGMGQFVLRQDALERATLSGGELGIITAGLHVIVGSGRFTALLEEL